MIIKSVIDKVPPVIYAGTASHLHMSNILMPHG